MTARPAGRPRVGVQVTTTVPPAVLEAVDRIAAQCGQPRAAVLRDLITEGAARRMELETPGEDQVMQVTQTLRPLAAMIAHWIGGAEGQQRRERYIRYARAAGHPERLIEVLQRIAAELIIDGSPAGALDVQVLHGLAVAGDAGPVAGWRGRAHLFFEVMAELSRRNITLPRDEGGDGADLEFGPPPEDEDYA
ncbi:hypothetical protein [Thermobispora bispora]|uniref:hypothetical protein n=1 Tax=Thermobispora bispora TaxID=2006 RepID=UPI00197EA672|nr:hypothetical protein [Thermobispora bispora]